MPTIAPSRGTHVTLARADLPLVAGAIVPAGEGRSIFALPVARPQPDRDHRQQLRRRHRPRPPVPTDIDYLLEATNTFFGTSFVPRAT